MHAVPKIGTVRRSHFWDRVWVHFFEVFCVRVAEAQSFGFNEILWLRATGRAIVPNLNAGCLNTCICNFLFVARGRPLLWILRFCGLIFGTA